MDFSAFINQKRQYAENIELMKNVSQIIGEKWIEKKLNDFNTKQEKNKMLQEKDKHVQRFDFLTESDIHPLISMFYHIRRWNKEYEANQLLSMENISEQIVKLYYLYYILSASKDSVGFEKFLTRLKKINEYEFALFEIEVAFYYKLKDKNVEFLEEQVYKTPDLKISNMTSSIFVECKCKNNKSEEDKEIENFFNQLQKILLNECSKRSLYAIIVIHYLAKPHIDDLIELKKFILNSISNGGLGLIENEVLIQVPNPTDKFKVAVKRLELNDGIQTRDGLYLPKCIDLNYSFVMAFGNENGKAIEKPQIFAYRNEVIQVNIKSYERIFKSAVKQLPKEGGGIVWIRIPEHKWDNEIGKAKEAVGKLIKGSYNTRVNAVVFMTMRTNKELINSKQLKIIYSPKYEIVEHNNPKIKI